MLSSISFFFRSASSLFLTANTAFLCSASLCLISALSLMAIWFSSSYCLILRSVSICYCSSVSFLYYSINFAWSFILSNEAALTLALSRFSSISSSFNYFFSFYFISPNWIFSSIFSRYTFKVYSLLAAPSCNFNFIWIAFWALSSLTCASLRAFASFNCFSLSSNSFCL